MDEIILYGHSGSGNHGCEAIVRSTLKILNKECIIYSSNPEQDEKYGLMGGFVKRYSINIPQNSFRRYFYALYCRIFRKSMIRYRYTYTPFLDNIKENAIYLSVGGDHYCYGKYSNHIYDFLSNTIIDKGSKSVLWSCSVEGNDLDASTIRSLKRYDLIIVRESISYQNLIEKGIQKNVVLLPDVAFQLDATDIDLPEGMIPGKTVGINVSPMIQKYSQSDEIVLKNYERLIEYILENSDCTIALIPHVVWEDTDDRKPLGVLYEKYKVSGRVALIEDGPAQEMKGIISKCCFFVGARTHATIAAYSSCIPTLVIGYSVKARGIARDIFGTEDGYVIPVQSMQNENDLLEVFLNLWNIRFEIASYLKTFMPNYCNRVGGAAELLEKL